MDTNNEIKPATTGEAASPSAKPEIKRLQKHVQSSFKKWKREFKNIRRSREYVRGESSIRESNQEQRDVYQKEMSQAGTVIRANLIFATLQGMLPHIYAKNPEITVLPGQQVDPEGDDYEMADKFAQTLEIVENESFLRADLKRRAKTVIRAVQAARVGIVKVGYQRDKYSDPIIKNQMNDSQDNVAHLEKVISDLKEGGNDTEEEEILLGQAKDTYASLEGRVEVVRSEGLVIDSIRIEDFRLDPNLDTIEEYKQARWMAHVTYMRPQKIGTTYMLPKEETDKLVKYRRTEKGIPQRLEGEDQGDTGEYSNDVCAVWEYWDKDTNSVYTWAEGGSDWLRAPWQPNRMGEVWFPFFILGFNWIDGMEWPIADAEFLMELQDEYNTVRTQQAEHRELSAPFWLGDSSRVNRADIETFRDTVLGDVALINAGGQPVSQVFQPAVVPPMNPAVYDTTPIRSDIEWLSGLGDAQRGSVQKAKTATEATMVEQGLANRVGEKQDTTEDWLTDISKFVAEVLLQEMSFEQVQRIAGSKAVWPQADKKRFFDMVAIDIRAGSTGKPDMQREREQWGQIMPVVMQMVDKILAMRMQGVPDDQNSYVQILKETLRRFDERLDIEKIIPRMTTQQGMQQQGQPQQGQPQGQPPQGQGQQSQIPPELLQKVVSSLNPQQQEQLQQMSPEQQMQVLTQMAQQMMQQQQQQTADPSQPNPPQMSAVQ